MNKSPLTRVKTRLSVGWITPRWLADADLASTPAAFLKKMLPFQKCEANTMTSPCHCVAAHAPITMALSGELPLERYHRASSIGEGTFGSVVTVYNDNGEEYALKLFAKEEETDPIDLGALREISCLRLLRGKNRHDNIISLVDVQGSSADLLDEDEDGGAGTGGCLGMALPLFAAGSVAGALEEKRLQSLPRRQKIVFAHCLLSAVAFLHDNGILHRDIKSDNVLLKFDENGCYQPVLIDFSLAKPIDTTMFQSNGDSSSSWKLELEGFRHTGEVGTVTYTAPEIFSEEESFYGRPVDLWSLGVVLLEVWQDALLQAQKNSHALKQIETILSQMPTEKPFPDLLRNLLQVDPEQRWTARTALQSDAFAKLNLAEPPVRKIVVSTSLPVDYDENDIANQENPPTNAAKRKALKRRQVVERLCNELGGAEHAMTIPAALDYASQMEQLEDELDDLEQSTALLDCVVLAFRFWERETIDLEGLSEHSQGPFANWDLQNYIENETTLFLLLDYCLYPRFLR